MKTNFYIQTAKAGSRVIILLIALLYSTIIYAQSSTITVISPNGGETWLQGSTCTISWEYSGGPAAGYIEYSEDGGQYWYYLDYIYALDSINSYTFQNYIYPTSQAKIRISDYNNPAISDESDNVFNVVEPAVYVYSPYFGSFYYYGSEVYISWYSNSIETFSLEYSLDNGETWSSIIDDYTGFEYSWTAPEVSANEALIRIANAEDSSSYGLSPVFSIVELPDLTITSPNGGEIWNYNQNATVSWTGTNLPPYVYVEFSYDGGVNWSNLGYGYSTPEGGSAEFSVPYAATENALVRITDYNFYIVLDQSDAPFTVNVPPVLVYYPYGGESYYNNSQIYFSWLASAGISLLNFELSTDNGQNWQSIAEGIDATQGYLYWTVAGNPSSSCFIRISDASDSSKFGISGMFTILETPVITLTSPTGGEIWNTGATYNINWTYDNPSASYVYLEYSTDSGQTWNFINYSMVSGTEGNYEWVTPVISSEECQIRIMDYYLNFVSTISNPFTIITFPETPICMVSVDSTTNHNVVVWEKPVSDLINQFVIYKESNEANVYEIIGTVNYEDEAVITDTNSNPNIKSYRYKLGFADADGNIYPAADLHQTIHLTINQGVGNTWNLIWTSYIGFEVASYNIYRKSAGGNYEMISTISASFNSYTDLTAPAGDVYYIVEVINPNGCNPAARSGEYGSSYSNVATSNVLGVNDPDREIAVSSYPNPANEKLFISAGETLQGKVRIVVNDLLGHTVYSQEVEDMKKNSVYTVNTADLKEGIYMMKVSSEKGSMTRKIIIKH
jgi:hypothetical protein